MTSGPGYIEMEHNSNAVGRKGGSVVAATKIRSLTFIHVSDFYYLTVWECANSKLWVVLNLTLWVGGTIDTNAALPVGQKSGEIAIWLLFRAVVYIFFFSFLASSVLFSQHGSARSEQDSANHTHDACTNTSTAPRKDSNSFRRLLHRDVAQYNVLE